MKNRLTVIHIIALVFALAGPMLVPMTAQAVGIAQQKIVTKTVTGFAPPKLDYAKICIVVEEKAIPVNAKESSLSTLEKLRVASHLLRGGKNIFPDPTRAIRMLREIMKTETPEAARAKMAIARLYLQGNYLPENQDKALELIEEVAPSDPYDAGYILARVYEHTGGYGKAEQYYKRAALAGNPIAYLSRAYMYRDGLVPNVTQKQINQLVKLAETQVLQELVEGNCKSMHDFGKIFLRDSFNSDNHPIGIRWLEEAAKADDLAAISYLGHLYLYGIQVKQDVERGLNYYRNGASMHDSESLYRLGVYWLLKKSGTTENLEKAEKYLERAAKQGHQSAIKRLIKYYRGEYSEKVQYAKAAALMQRAITIPDIAAEIPFMLGEAYLKGDGVEKNEKKAYQLFDKAAKMNYRDAMLKLGDAYKYGIGIERNPIKSYRFYRQAAMVGSRDSMIALVENYQCGVGKPPNKTYYNVWKQRAIHEGAGKILRPEVRRLMLSKDEKDNQAGFLLLKRRSGQNDREARVMLSHFYRHGVGTQKNEQLAALWLKEAIVAGEDLEKGYTAIGEAYMDETMFGIQPKNAEKYFIKAMKIGSKDAGYELGKLYDEGAKDFPKNTQKAIIAYRDSARRGNDNAMRKLARIYIEQDKVEEGIKLLERSSAMHNIDSILELVNHYVSQPKEDEAAFKKALYWHKKARHHYPCAPHTRAKLNRLTAKINQRDGEAISENPADILQSAKEGNVRAMRKMAQIYIYGSAGIQPNPKVAFKWYLAAAKRGDALAMFEIGNAYSTGLGVKISKDKAREWWKKSAEAGNKKAAQMLAVDPRLVETAPKKKVH